MARLLCLGLLLALLASPFLGVLYVLFLRSPPPLPDFDVQEWWGPKELQDKHDTSIKPFKVQFSATMIQDLKERLKNHRKWTPPLENIAFEYGFNTKQLDSWVSYWAEKYNFQEREQFFNKFPQFKTNVQGLDIHFIRVKPEVPAGVEVVPMLFLHGWPGSVREFYEALPLLTAVSKDRDFAIEAIVPSLPGYGFSSAAVRPGLGAAEMAVVMRNLMHRLGFKQFYVQGGDWGSIIGSNMATIFPKEVLGYHTNMGSTMSTSANVLNLLGAVLPSFVVESKLAARMYPLSSTVAYLLEETGYMHIQATKPDTIGVAISDSPVGLLAYILEKFSTWTKPQYKQRADGGLGEVWTKDQLLDNLMCYWATNSFTTSVRLYSESFNKRQYGLQLDEIPTPVPTWVIQAKNELAFQSARILRTKFKNLVHANPIDDGGHFLAFELPKVFSKDVLEAVAAFRRFKEEAKKTELSCVGGSHQVQSLLALLASPFLGVLYVLFLRSPPPVPDFDVQAWWGPKELQDKQDTSIKPFKVQFSATMIQDLKERLKNHRKWTPPLENIAFEYGFNTKQLDSWISYWAEKYNFQEREQFFNKFPQFKTNVQGLDIHFIRVKPEVPAGVEVIPMLFLHGWPGSVREFYEALPLLTAVSKDRDFAIEAIVPSLPGYGFSSAAVRPGLGAAEMAVVMRNLMHRLGFKQFYVQGGDWGSIIGSNMATIFPKEVLGYHTNLGTTMSTSANVLVLLGAVLPSFVVESKLAARMYPLSSTVTYLLEETGYMHIQATKPDTIGVAISDSPVGLLAYILEKFSTWTKPHYKQRADGGLGEVWTKDQLLDNLMCYWSTNSFTTSVRLYSEFVNKRQFGLKLDEIPTFVPTWVIQAKNELGFQSARILRTKFKNLVHANPIDDGGHFLAFELPQLFSKDVLEAVAAFRRLKKEAKKTEL